MAKATEELKDIKEASGSMLPEDRVARTMDLQEDIASKLEILKKNAEGAITEGLSKPSSLDEVKALHEKVHNFEKTTDNYLKVLNAANEAAQKMTTHADVDAEVAALRERHVKVKAISDEWVNEGGHPPERVGPAGQHCH